jgi:hypothetical protein
MLAHELARIFTNMVHDETVGYWIGLSRIEPCGVGAHAIELRADLLFYAVLFYVVLFYVGVVGLLITECFSPEGREFSKPMTSVMGKWSTQIPC